MPIRSATSALMSLEDARARLLAVPPVTSRKVPVSGAVGLVTAQDIFPMSRLPIRSAARRDGWAVDAISITGASPNAPIALTTPSIWVEDGDAMPTGTDTVLPPDALDTTGEVVADAAQGDGASRPGDEIAASEVLVRSGTRLASLEILALHIAGFEEVGVRRPRIRLVDVSDRPGSPLSEAVAAWIRSAGAIVTPAAAARNESAIADAIAAAEDDAVFVLGGTGFGRTDHAARALMRAGQLDAHGLALRPGESAGFGRIGPIPVLMLPGRPEAALAVWLTLGRPLLARLTASEPARGRTECLTRKITSTIGMSEIVFVRRAIGGVEPIGGADLPLRRLILAQAAVLVPPEREGYPEGETVGILNL